jgi:Capsule assembly protein Wzi
MVGAALASVVLGGPASGTAQSIDVGDSREDYLRLLQLTGDAPLNSFSLRPLVRREDAAPLGSAGGPWRDPFGREPLPSDSDLSISPLEARLRFFANTAFPFVANDGVVWQGRGLTSAVDFGTTLEWRGLRVTAKPMMVYAQNQSFELATVEVEGMPAYAYPWRKIDLPQRFGPDAVWTLDPGQSEIRLSGWGATGGVSTRNLWWGPGIRSAIVMSNNAAGVPHAFVGTRGPRDIGIGTIEANWIWGRLGQSDYFDPTVENDDRFLTGLVVAYSPSFLEGLSLGLTRVYYGAVPPGGLPFSDLFLVFQGVSKDGLITPENPTGDDDKDQLLSLFGRWALPESGFEVYVEWARNDHSGNLTDFLLEPEHSQGYTLGLQKAVPLSGGRRLALRGELTHLEREATFRLRASPVYYAHNIVTQGYTQNGQVIGAGVGPGGNQQHLGVDLYAPWGRLGLVAQRRVQDNDAFYDWAAANGASFDKHDVAFDFVGSGLLFRGDFELGASLMFTRQLNRYFYGPDVSNLNFGLTAHWRPRP